METRTRRRLAVVAAGLALALLGLGILRGVNPWGFVFVADLPREIAFYTVALALAGATVWLGLRHVVARGLVVGVIGVLTMMSIGAQVILADIDLPRERVLEQTPAPDARAVLSVSEVTFDSYPDYAFRVRTNRGFWSREWHLGCTRHGVARWTGPNVVTIDMPGRPVVVITVDPETGRPDRTMPLC